MFAIPRRTLLAAAALTFAAGFVPATAADDALAALIAGPQRSEKNTVRDRFRHPLEVLEFFGLKPTETVVEIEPGAGAYWLEILAPYLKDHGTYYAAQPPATDTPESQKGEAAFSAKLASDPALYGKVITTRFSGDKFPIAPAGTADLVVTWRNLHNWLEDGSTDAALHAFFVALKPGGILGIVDHRGRTDIAQDPVAKSGYVREDYAIQLIEKAGFKLVARSDVNANPKDTKDYPDGVWTLPPTYRLKDVDHAKYEAIGESDRFTLKFEKPVK